jgi:DNA-binding phage protein
MSQAHDDERATAILSRKARGLLALDEALAELADANCTSAMAVMIAERVGLPRDAVARALDAESDETISVICRAAGLRINSYSAVLRMRRRRNRGTGSAPAAALMFFSDLSQSSAQRFLQRLTARDPGERSA